MSCSILFRAAPINLVTMKNILSTLLFSLALFCACNSYNVRVDGMVHSGIANGDSIFLIANTPSGNREIVDRAVVAGGGFTLQASVELPAICSVVTFTPALTTKTKHDFIAEGSPVTLQISSERAVVSGSPLNSELQSFNDSLFMAKKIYFRYFEKRNDSIGLSNMGKKEADDIMAVTAQFSKNVLYNVLQENKDNMLAVYLIKNYYFLIDPADGLRFINELPQSVQKDNVIRYMAKIFRGRDNAAVGKPFVNFLQNNVKGEPVQLSSVAGKGVPVALCFWSSGNAASVAAHERLSAIARSGGEALQLVGVSIDDNYRRWNASLAKNGFAGIQLADMRGWNNDALSLYGIDTCPFFVLIGKDGTITHRTGSVAEFENAINSVLGK